MLSGNRSILSAIHLIMMRCFTEQKKFPEHSVMKFKSDFLATEKAFPLLKLLELFACTLMLPATFIMIF